MIMGRTRDTWVICKLFAASDTSLYYQLRRECWRLNDGCVSWLERRSIHWLWRAWQIAGLTAYWVCLLNDHVRRSIVVAVACYCYCYCCWCDRFYSFYYMHMCLLHPLIFALTVKRCSIFMLRSKADNGSVGHDSWVIDQMGQHIWMGHIGHGSVSVTHWTTSKSVKCEQLY